MPLDTRLLIPKRPSTSGVAPPPAGPTGTGITTQGGAYITTQGGDYLIAQ